MIVGAGLKMFMGHQQAVEWVGRVADLARRHPGVQSGDVDLFVLPTFLLLAQAVKTLSPVGVQVGAQDLFWEDSGPYTGEVSGSEIAEVGCSLVEVGHHERRSLFGESDAIISMKTAAAFRNGLTPIVCVGEGRQRHPDDAASASAEELQAALAGSREAGLLAPILVAYEPHWAIGAAAAAPADYIRTVCTRLKSALSEDTSLAGSRVIYGGSAGAGLLGQLGGAVDGLFLGRASHDPSVLESVVDEAAATAMDRR